MHIIKFCYNKNASLSNHYNFGKVKAIDFLFSTFHSTPLFCSEIDFGVLH